MTPRWRSSAVVLGLLGLLVVGPSARATHCPPDHPPHPPAVDDDYPCPDTSPPPKRTAKPTPKPTPKPTTAPAPAPTRAPEPAAPAPVAPRPASTPQPTAFEIEVPEGDPLATPEIIVDSIDDPGGLDVEGAEETASASSWIFGFLVGFIIGGLLGRASWGLRKRRRQQIFG